MFLLILYNVSFLISYFLPSLSVCRTLISTVSGGRFVPVDQDTISHYLYSLVAKERITEESVRNGSTTRQTTTTRTSSTDQTPTIIISSSNVTQATRVFIQTDLTSNYTHAHTLSFYTQSHILQIKQFTHTVPCQQQKKTWKCPKRIVSSPTNIYPVWWI